MYTLISGLVLSKCQLWTISLLMMTQEALVNSVDQDQITQNMQSDLWSTLFPFVSLD